MVESVDYFPAQSSEGLHAHDLKPLLQVAFEAPFYDEIIYLTNCMPADRTGKWLYFFVMLLNIEIP